jgi:uncharacterized protein
MNPRQLKLFAILLTLICGVPFLRKIAHLLTESWWFRSIQLESVFGTKIGCQMALSISTFLFCVAFLGLSYRWAIATHSSKSLISPDKKTKSFASLSHPLHESYLKEVIQTQNLMHLGVSLLIVAISVLGGISVAHEWDMVLKCLNAVPFNSTDPIFHIDLGFYILQLPFLQALLKWVWQLWTAGFILAVLVYSFQGDLVVGLEWSKMFSGRAKHHLSLFGCGFSLLGSLYFWLERYRTLYLSGGIVYGAGYAEVYGDVWIYKLLSLMGVVLAILFWRSAHQRSWRPPLIGMAVFIGTWILLHGGYVWVLQQFIVSPNELFKEKPFLTHNIQATQAAYSLNRVEKRSFAAESELDQTDLAQNEPTISNIRLWDYKPTLTTYRQLQEIRLYYKFSDVDVDRYTFNGKYQQVMISAREMAPDQLPIEARTWVNQRLKYTHGYGLAMSPVSETTTEGAPEFYIQNIPPEVKVDLALTEPAIYYGEETKTYVFTGTTTEEFDYPHGETNAYTMYQGQGGVAIPTFWHRLLYASEMRDLRVLTSHYFTNQSRIHYYRQVVERVKHIAPFLHFDHDPYLSVANGHLYWILDAYTISDHYPYSESIAHAQEAATTLEGETTATLLKENINYIRNSVKVVIDAYDGTLTFYAVDDVDPILATYQKIFPRLFTPVEKAPVELITHFRYPKDLFQIQAQMYLTYHMSDPEEFYNREDLWRFPYQTYERSQVLMRPYYMVMPLSDQGQPEFIQIQPFTPANKDNMLSWLAARGNSKNSTLLLYEFPKQKLVYGPRQIEARIDQTPSISQSFSLWNQSGSRVIRGELLVIPVEQSLLYVEPIYLRAESGEVPELKRVIVAYDKFVVMEETLEKALATIFGQPNSEQRPDKKAAMLGDQSLPIAQPLSKSKIPEDRTTETLVKEALTLFERAESAMHQGDWEDYGRYQTQLKVILRRLNGQPAQDKVSGEAKEFGASTGSDVPK